MAGVPESYDLNIFNMRNEAESTLMPRCLFFLPFCLFKNILTIVIKYVFMQMLSK